MENWEVGLDGHIDRLNARIAQLETDDDEAQQVIDALEDQVKSLTDQLAEQDRELAKWAEGETYTAYGHEFVGGLWRSEPRGKNYSSHQRTVWMSAPTLIHHWREPNES